MYATPKIPESFIPYVLCHNYIDEKFAILFFLVLVMG